MLESKFYLRLDLLAPVLLALTNVSLVAELSHLLCLREELISLLRECLLYREVTNLYLKFACLSNIIRLL